MMTNRPKIPYPSEGPGKAAVKPSTPPQAPAMDDETFEEDFTGTETGFPMAEEGLHHAKVIDFEKSDSRSGHPQYVWQFRITNGPSAGMEVRYWTSLLPQARWKTAETLEAVGITAVGSIAKFRRSDIVGRPCIIDIVHETFEDRLTNKVRRVHPPTEASIKYAKADDVPF